MPGHLGSRMRGAGLVPIRPETPKSSNLLKDRKLGRDQWATTKTQDYIYSRLKVRDVTNQMGSPVPHGIDKEEIARTLRKREAVASLQGSAWPYAINFVSPGSKIQHPMPSPDKFTYSRTYGTGKTMDGTRASTSYSKGRRSSSALDGLSAESQLKAPSLANQRYQYHILLSRVNLSQDEGESPGDMEGWDETRNCTGGSKTDSLIPGASHSNGPRWAPTAVSPHLTAHAEPLLKRVPPAPLTGAAYIQASREEKAQRKQTWDKRRVFEHARKQGVQDVESWLESMAEITKRTPSATRTEDATNTWSLTDKHDWIAVGGDGLSLTASYKAIKDRNALVRTSFGYTQGRHYWEITLQRFDVFGVGWHYIGVAAPDDDVIMEDSPLVMGASAKGAALCLEHCQKVGRTRQFSIPQQYGHRAVKSGDIIGVLLDLDLGELSFFVNGEDLGVAFYGMRGPLYPAVEMGLMVGQHHEYVADFAAPAPPRRRMEAPPKSDEEAFKSISEVLPRTSKKYHQEGFGEILSVPSTMPNEAPGGINHVISVYPQIGEYTLFGSGGQPRRSTKAVTQSTMSALIGQGVASEGSQASNNSQGRHRPPPLPEMDGGGQQYTHGRATYVFSSLDSPSYAG